MSNYDGIVSQIEMAIKRHGPAPSLICKEINITRKTFHEFLRHYANLRALYYERIQVLLQAIDEKGANKMLIAQHAGYTRIQITRFINENEELKTAFTDADEAIVDKAQQKLMEKLEMGDWDSIKQVLDTKGRNLGWSHTEKVNLDQESARLGIPWQEVMATITNAITDSLNESDAGDSIFDAPMQLPDFGEDLSTTEPVDPSPPA